ncbi:MAG TPA: DUF192 domain-containing protein [Phycisphaerae bacterium]|nr:DUF192 domain-containing protein [Phycisphaerae bacterium]
MDARGRALGRVVMFGISGAGLALLSAVALPGCFGQTAPNSQNGGASSSRPAQTPRQSDRSRTFDLDTLATSTIQVNGHEVRVWLARTSAEQAEGLMHVPAEEIADDQGMLFVFSDEDLRFFWMKNTITALDIAYARADGKVVKTWRMPPLTLQSFPSVEPAMFALEMKAGAFERLGLTAGARIVIPHDVFKASR